jgi:hypothetical chaperone protein
VSPACGIDFGTSNSSAGFVRDGAPVLVKVEGESTSIPSAIFYPAFGGNICFGGRAIESYVEGENGRLFRAIKSILGSSLITETTVAGGKRAKFTAILGSFLGHIKKTTEEQAGAPIEQAVLGRPVFFVDGDAEADRTAQDQLMQVARAQGFKHIEFQYEPIAAALDYEHSVKGEEIALIADIGGGTSDFSIVRVSSERRNRPDRKQDILAYAGVHVGGTDLDYKLSLKQVMPHFGYQTRQRKRPELDLPNGYFHELALWHRIAFLYSHKVEAELKHLRAIAEEPEKIERFLRVVHERAGHRVAGETEKAKIGLSDNASATIDLTSIIEGLSIETSRALFEETIRAECAKIAACVEECIKSAGLRAEAIDAVFLTGGSTSTPAVEKACLLHTPRAKIVRGNKFASVGMGLTIDSGLKFGGTL